MVILHENALPLSFDLSLLATLDLGAHDNSNKSQVVSTYEHIWWSGCKLRDLGTVTILDGSTLEACLNSYHLKRSQSPASAGCVHAGGTGLSSGTSLMAGISATLGQIPQGPAPFIPAQGTHSLATSVQVATSPPSHCYVAPLVATSPLSLLRRPSHCYVAPLVATSPLSLLRHPSHCYVAPLITTSPL
ncbi:hypothetical protein BYT27DRAFT_7252539 [Phlegmacium glaucopus]|nr:hypothetical protein BYT27DRAFT_7252539 [Phlegmacium glaucopus]